jgi:hypothetical protein
MAEQVQPPSILTTHGRSTGRDTVFDDPEYPAQIGTPDYAHYERDYTDREEMPVMPYYPGAEPLSYNPHFGLLRHQLESGPYPAYVAQAALNEFVDFEGVNAYDTDPWVIHAGDANQKPRESYTDGVPATQSRRLLVGPNTGALDPWSGYTAKLRTPQFGQPGPNTGTLPGSADANLSVQIANQEAMYANQLAEEAINNSVFQLD